MFQDLWGQWGKFSLSWCKSDVYHLKLIKVKRGTVKSNENIFGLCSMPPMPGMPPRPNYMQNGPPVSMPGSNPMSTQSGPSKPLFPSAQSSSATISAPPTANFKAGSSTAPVKPTFPSAAAALSNNSPVHSSATITGAPQIKKPESSSGLTSKLIHPEEDISLEEKRAMMPKYRRGMGNMNQGPGRPPASNMMGGMGNGSGGSNMYGSGMSYQGQSGYRPPMTSRQY